MSRHDPNILFSQAEQFYQRGDMSNAQRNLLSLMRIVPDHPAILHLAGLVWRRLGALNESLNFLDRASKVDRANPQLFNNLGNVQSDLGNHDAAETSYSRALELQPTFADALLNRANTRHKLGDFERARKDFDAACRLIPNSAAAWSARGAMELTANEPRSASLAYDQALALQPDHPRALHGRARAALLLAHDDAVARYEIALEADPANREILLGLAFARQSQGMANPEMVLEAALDADPAWIDGQKAYAEMVWESGRPDMFDARLSKALAKAPQDSRIRQTLCAVYAGVDQFEAAAQCARQCPASSPDKAEFQLQFAIHIGDAGDVVQSVDALGQLDATSPQVQLHTARNLLRMQDFHAADRILEQLRQRLHDNISVWALSDIAWRKLGDPRHAWLHGQPGLYGASTLNLDAGRINVIAKVLERAHTSSVAPIGQSMRGGTQTRGRLLVRDIPEIMELRAAIVEAVDRHWDSLPALDDSHPLLKHRQSRPVLDGSWSVNLNNSGFHVSHIHPNGLLSSACYIIVPDLAQDSATKAGWLEIGSCPSNLAVDLAPLETIQPQPGRIVIFPSTLYHGTRPFTEGQRMSVAFDVVSSNSRFKSHD